MGIRGPLASWEGRAFEVTWRGILLALLAPGVIAGIITAFVTLVPYLGLETPASRADRAAKADSIQFGRLRDALRIEDPGARAQAVRILIDLGRIEDPYGALRARTAFPDSLPRWP